MKDNIFTILNKLINKIFYIFKKYKNFRYTVYYVIILFTTITCLNIFYQIKNQRGMCIKTTYFDLIYEGDNIECICNEKSI